MESPRPLAQSIALPLGDGLQHGDAALAGPGEQEAIAEEKGGIWHADTKRQV